MNKFLYLCFTLCFSCMVLHARSSKCEGCVRALRDSNVVCKIAYGYSTDRKKAETQAKNKARRALLKELCDSVAEICHQVEVKRDAEGEYLRIKYFSEEEKGTKYYFHEDGILNHIKIRCRDCVLNKKNGKYEACYVLSAPKEEFSRASDIVMFQILKIMSYYQEQD